MRPSAKYLDTNIPRNNNIYEPQCENVLRGRWLKNLKMLSWDSRGSQEDFKTDDVSFYTTYYYT